VWRGLITRDVGARLDRLDLPFNRHGLDPYGISREHLGVFYSLLGPFYRRYFRVQTFGIEHVPTRGAAMLVGNHSGGLPVDGGMVLGALFFDHDPPRHCHGMVEYFAQTWPVVSPWFSRIGQLTGLPEHALRLLGDGRLLMVFPEGVRGVGKLYRDRYRLERFGTGFCRIALRARAPIVPLAFIGGEEALPTVFHARRLARFFHAPYWPVPPYLAPLPLPLPCELHFGEPLVLAGDGDEDDDVIEAQVARVRERIAELIDRGRAVHERRLRGEPA
jgi:1-acyl-sn-glycerol-3-phosphate acyltransferase